MAAAVILFSLSFTLVGNPCLKGRSNAGSGTGHVTLLNMIMKFVRDELLLKTQSLLDPLQFAYQARRGVEDASSTLLNTIMKYLDGRKTHVRLLFVDFSSAFNTIQPHVLVKKLI